jgi:predicted RNA-binding protein with PIN domain
VRSLKSAEEKAGLAAGRRALLATIAASRILRSDRVIVVFDASETTAVSEPSPHPSLAVRFSTPPADADATILDLLARSKGELLTVVTADSELSFEARKLGANVVAPEGWEPLKTGKTGKRPKGKGGTASGEKPQASAKDVDYWLGIFGEGSSDEE